MERKSDAAVGYHICYMLSISVKLNWCPWVGVDRDSGWAIEPLVQSSQVRDAIDRMNATEADANQPGIGNDET